MLTVTLATDEFEALAHLQARAMGFPNLRIFTITHPLGGVSEDLALAKVEGAAASVAGILLAQ